MSNINGQQGSQGLHASPSPGQAAADLVFLPSGLSAIASGEGAVSAPSSQATNLAAITAPHHGAVSAPSSQTTNLAAIAAPHSMEPNSTTKPQLPKLSAELANGENHHYFSEIAGRYGGADQTVACFDDILHRLQVKFGIPVGFSTHYEMCALIDQACQDLGLVDILKDKGTGGLTDTHINQLADTLQETFLRMPNEPYKF